MPADFYTPMPMDQRSREEEVVEVLSRVDVACPRCGYSLRGLRSTSCPECGARVDLDEIAEGLRETGLLGVLRSPGMFGVSLLLGAFSAGLMDWSVSGTIVVVIWLTLCVLWLNSMFVWSLEVCWFRASQVAWAPACALVAPMIGVAACTRFC